MPTQIVPPDPPASPSVAQLRAWIQASLMPWVTAMTAQTNKLTDHEVTEATIYQELGEQHNIHTVVERLREDHLSFKEGEN